MCESATVSAFVCDCVCHSQSFFSPPLHLHSERARSSKSLTRNGLQQQQQQAEEAAAGRGASDDISGMAPTWEVSLLFF